MQITYKNKTYKWIGDKWGQYKVIEIFDLPSGVGVFLEDIGGDKPEKYTTGHTPEQLVKLGYMELIETKPEEKPTYWYIETEEMKKSEYWEVFKEWYIKATNDDTYKWTSEMYGKSETYYFNGYLQYVKDGCKKLSPQQWHDTIYKPDHDKAMEIPEVPPFNTDIYKEWKTEVDMIVGYGKHLHLITNSLNAVIKKINNL